MGKLDGKVAFITGAARGQGRSHAYRLAEEGTDIIGIDLCGEVEGVGYGPATLEDLAETQRGVEQRGRRAITGRADVRDADSMRAILDPAVAELGRLDIVSANAGIVSLPATTIEQKPELWRQMIDINLSGVWNTCRISAPHIIAGGEGGSIVITSSSAALKAYPNIGDYMSAKHGLVGLTRALAMELGEHRIRVNHIAPTSVGTEMIFNESIYGLFSPENPTKEGFAEVSQSAHLLPIPWVEPIDVSNALLFLVSDDGRYITSISLPVDAGATQH